MAAADYTNLVQELYISYFGRPADPVGATNIANAFNAAKAPTTLAGLLNVYATNATVKSVVDSFSASAESQALYGSDAIGFVSAVYHNVLNRDADLAGAKFWINAIQHEGLSMGKAALAIMAGALSNTTDPQGLLDKQVVENKVAIAGNFTTAINGSSTDVELNAYSGAAAAKVAHDLLATVTATSDVTAFQASVTTTLTTLVELAHPPVVVPPAVPFDGNLSVGQDVNKVGTDGDDVFTAQVVQNVNGEQTNQLATGDKITGGTGNDTLNATVQMASALNHAPASAILPTTVGLENANFTALTVDNSSSPAAMHEVVTINAKQMLGLNSVGSVQSDASLVIENLTTLTDSGVYGERRNTESVTIRMDHTGNDKAVDAASDLTVLFDNDYLLSGATNSASLELRMVNLLSLAKTSQPVSLFTSVSFTVNDVLVTTDVSSAVGLTGLAAYTAIQTAIKAQLATQGITGVEVNLLTPRTVLFSDDVVNETGTGLSYKQGELAGSYSPILVTSAGQPLGKGNIVQDTNAINANILNTETTLATSAANPVTATIELEKVGRGAEGGDLTVGGMSTNFANVFNHSDSAIKEGVEKFNITVSGDATQFSDLASLQSTNNTLAIVNVNWQALSKADLIIGNHNTAGVAPNGALSSVAPVGVAGAALTAFHSSDDDMTSAKNNALKDVRDFTANNTLSNVSVYATLSDEVVAKYMDLTDTAGNPVEPKAFDSNGIATTVAHNADFVYNFGAGNDLLNINLSKTNLAQSGTTNREDFTFKTSAGLGNDKIQTQIGDGIGATTSDWYINSVLNNNLSIDAGDGNDTVQVFGAGHWNVTLGNGDDVIYSDNSGNQHNVANDFGVEKTGANFNSGRAVWVLNSANQTSSHAVGATLLNLEARNVDDNATVANDGIQSSANSKAAFFGTQLTVSLRGITSKGIDITANATSDLELNNLIKKAIHDDVYLSKLIVAEDGPGASLVIRSLVDGVHTDSDFSVDIARPAAIATMTQVQLDAFNAANNLTTVAAKLTTTAQVQAYVDAAIATFNVVGSDYDSAMANDGVNFLYGADSTVASSNVISDGAGRDVIVLSTGTDFETVNLTADHEIDVIYNITSGTKITGLIAADYTGVAATNKGDILVYANGHIATLAEMTANSTVINGVSTFTAPNGIDVAGIVVTTPTLSVSAPAAAAEGTNATFTVTLSAAQTGATTVAYALTGTGGAVLGTDTTAVANGTLTFAAGEVTKTVVVPVTVDALVETGEGVQLTLSSPSTGAALATTATATVNFTDAAAASTAAVAVAAAGTTTDGGATVSTTYTLAAGTFTYNIAGFGSGDVLKMFAGAAVTVSPDADQADGIQDITFADAGTGGIVTIHLTGLSAAQDAGLFNLGSINTVFGAGTLV